MLRDLRKAQAIEHPIGGHAAFARHLDAPMRQIEFAGGMGVGVDAHHAAEIERTPMPAPIEIEPPGIGIDLDGDAIFGTGNQNLFDIDLISGPPQQLPPRHVAENSGVGIGHGTDDPLRLFLAIHLEAAMHARHHEIATLQDCVGIIEGTIAEDVGFNALEDAKILSEGLIELVDGAVLRRDLGERMEKIKFELRGAPWTEPSIMEVLFYGRINFPNKDVSVSD